MKGLEITTNIGCSVACSYCPQGVLLDNYNGELNLSMERFKQCISKVPKTESIFFAGFSEPWLNEECSEMVSYTYSLGYSIYANTTLEGITINDVMQLQYLHFDNFAVHLPDVGMSTKADIFYLNRLAMVISLIDNVELRKHLELDPPVADMVEYMTVKQMTLNDRAGNADLPHQKTTGELKECGNANRHVLLPNGDVVLCCMDYGLKHVLGNLIKDDYQVIKDNANELNKTLCYDCIYANNGGKDEGQNKDMEQNG